MDIYYCFICLMCLLINILKCQLDSLHLWKEQFCILHLKTSFEMSQSNYSSVNHNRHLGIVREKVPKGAAIFS